MLVLQRGLGGYLVNISNEAEHHNNDDDEDDDDDNDDKDDGQNSFLGPVVSGKVGQVGCQETDVSHHPTPPPRPTSMGLFLTY